MQVKYLHNRIIDITQFNLPIENVRSCLCVQNKKAVK